MEAWLAGTGHSGYTPFLWVGRSRMLVLMLVQEERLWIADPKAAHHILQSSSHLYQRSHIAREQIALVIGRGLSWAEGELTLTSPMI